MDYPETRSLAKLLGLKYYFTGKPCSNGHVALRETKGNCIECRKDQWNRANKKRLGLPKSDAAKAAGRRYYEKNRDMVIAKAATRPAELTRAYKTKHKKKNPEMYKALTSNRRRRHKNATPVWLSKAQRQMMREYYLLAQNMTKEYGELWVVDHIVPLISDKVCGLHVPWNLRLCTQKENLAKSNRLVDTL